MQLIIDTDDIQDNSKKEWLIRTLKLIGIKFKTEDGPQTLDEYNNDLEAGANEIKKGQFITGDDLKEQARKW